MDDDEVWRRFTIGYGFSSVCSVYFSQYLHNIATWLDFNYLPSAASKALQLIIFILVTFMYGILFIYEGDYAFPFERPFEDFFFYAAIFYNWLNRPRKMCFAPIRRCPRLLSPPHGSRKPQPPAPGQALPFFYGLRQLENRF